VCGTERVNPDGFVLSEAFIPSLKEFHSKQDATKKKKAVLASLIFHRSFWIFFLPFLNNGEKRGFLVACKLLLAGEQSLPRSSFLNVLLRRACQLTCAVARLHARL